MIENLLNRVQHHSVSSILKFKNCPRSWWADKVLDLKRESSVAASFGSQYDQLIAHKLGLKPSDVREDDIPIEEQELLPGVEEAVNLYFQQPHAVKKASSAQKKISIKQHEWILFAEELGISSELKKPVIGYIDLIEQNGIQQSIIDLKTSSRRGMRSDWALQVLIYCIAEQINFGKIQLMTKTKTPAYYQYPVIVTEETKAWAMNTFAFYANQIEAALENGSGENLSRNPDYYCAWCGEELDCPAKQACIG